VRRNHHDLLAWQQAILLVKLVYQLTSGFPQQETYGLVAQMRRAAISVPANIAEGAARKSAKEFTRFLAIARGSLSELETYLVISRELGYLAESDKLEKLMDNLFKLLSGLLLAQKRKDQA
jgi:four helix bundle protein